MTKSQKSSNEQQVPENFCIRPWTELHIEEDGKVTPCCVMPSNQYPMGNNIKEYFEGSALKNLRNAFLKNFVKKLSETTPTRTLKKLVKH